MAKHNKAFPLGRMNLDRLRRGYEIELANLITIAQSKFWNTCFSQASNHDAFIKSASHDGYKTLNPTIKQNDIIYFKNNKDSLFYAALTAHIVVCCELLDGSTIPFSILKKENLDLFTGKFFDRFGNLENDIRTRDTLEFKLHSIDAFRTIQILRGLGLFSRSPDNINQLSLGAGSAKKDIRSMHLAPKIRSVPGNTIHFNLIEQNAQDFIIIDGDPTRKTEYVKMSENQELPILAINDDALDVLSYLPSILEKNALKKRNTIVGLRIDHRMIPDIDEFLRKLSCSITDTADLIITIGSGFDLNDFTGRTKVMLELHNHLKNTGLSPLLIKLHGEGSIEEQWNSQSFGLREITTYQILYCRLIKNKLL